MACGVCRGGRRPLCSDSFEAFPETASRRSELTQWRAERDDALAQLEAGALTGKVGLALGGRAPALRRGGGRGTRLPLPTQTSFPPDLLPMPLAGL